MLVLSIHFFLISFHPLLSLNCCLGQGSCLFWLYGLWQTISAVQIMRMKTKISPSRTEIESQDSPQTVLLSFSSFPCLNWHSIKFQKILLPVSCCWLALGLQKIEVFLFTSLSLRPWMSRDFQLFPWNMAWWIDDDCSYLEGKYRGGALFISYLSRR